MKRPTAPGQIESLTIAPRAYTSSKVGRCLFRKGGFFDSIDPTRTYAWHHLCLLPTRIMAVAKGGIAETTVRTHLHRTYQKTGVNRQADLVKLVAAYSNPLVK